MPQTYLQGWKYLRRASDSSLKPFSGTSIDGGDVAQAVAKAVAPLRKRAAKAHDSLIIDTQNPTHENIPDYGYVQETSLEDSSPQEPICGNVEISINYTSVYETWDRNSIVVDDVFAYAYA
jgi:hypothetical protein